ncbi:MAG TPA: NPCBM/NEW2 domain-containing protein, partial [Candidatus Saccharimonadales bacterium]|nr:NPCBM/NEW2 domain-containing protein [Candidatus Saccharimonadales bacterium]
GVEDLSLVVTDAGDGISGDHADWIEPMLYRPNGKQRAQAAVPKAAYDVGVPGLQVRLSTNGEVVGLGFGPTNRERPVRAFTQVLGCQTECTVHATKLPGGGMEFVRTLINGEQRRIILDERFTPSLGSVRWRWRFATHRVIGPRQ